MQGSSIQYSLIHDSWLGDLKKKKKNPLNISKLKSKYVSSHDFNELILSSDLRLCRHLWPLNLQKPDPQPPFCLINCFFFTVLQGFFEIDRGAIFLVRLFWHSIALIKIKVKSRASARDILLQNQFVDFILSWNLLYYYIFYIVFNQSNFFQHFIFFSKITKKMVQMILKKKLSINRRLYCHFHDKKHGKNDFIKFLKYLSYPKNFVFLSRLKF